MCCASQAPPVWMPITAGLSRSRSLSCLRSTWPYPDQVEDGVVLHELGAFTH